MTFDARSKTPFGPFRSPELLDLKAPPAVHTAQGRIAAWNKEHNLDVTEHHVGINRQPIKGKAGPAQYEVQHCSASQLDKWRLTLVGKNAAICPPWLQALLHEILVSTGSVHTPANQPSHKRLACHVTLLRQLLQAGVFGPLQVHHAYPMQHPYLDDVKLGSVLMRKSCISFGTPEPAAQVKL